jgi:hypothetical protein
MFYNELKVDTNMNEKSELITGRLKETYQHFDNAKDGYMFDANATSIDEAKLEYFQKYAAAYFNGDFIEGQGAEELLNAAHRHQPRGDYLDLGSGPTGLFWCLPLSRATTITFSDVISEALTVLSQFRQGKNYPACYRQVMDLLNLPQEQLEQIFNTPARFAVFDCFSDWPSFVKQRAFSRISAYGVLSICRDPAHYRNAVARIADSLPKGGIFIGADWIRHAKYKQAEDGSDTSFLNQGLIHEALTKGQLRIRELETLSIVGDALYGQIIHWVAEKP